MKASDGLRVVRTTVTLRQQVADRIREAILEGRFLPGERLVERALCEQTGVSRTLIREAMRQLEAEGLLQIVPHRGPIVAVLTADEAKDIYEVRAALEALAGAAFAERAGPKERARLRAALKAVEAAYATSDVKDWLRAKGEFYGVLLEGANNTALTATLQIIWGRISLLRAMTMSTPGRGPQSVAELRRIVRAIEKRDPQTAWQVSHDHVMSAAAVALRALETNTQALNLKRG